MIAPLGSVAERLNAPVLKTGVGKPIVSSNLTGPASPTSQVDQNSHLFHTLNVPPIPGQSALLGRTASAQQFGVS